MPLLADHLEMYNSIDIATDPFPYNGTTTTCKALWMGVPVVTLAGTTHAGRVGATILNAIGMSGNTCADENAYVQRAAQLAHDPAALSAMRSSLRERLVNSPLCNGAGWGAASYETLETLAERSRLE